MIKLNPHSLKFRIGSSFLALGLLILFLLASCFLLLTDIGRKTIITNENTVAQHAYDLSNEITSSNVTLKNYVFSPNSPFSIEKKQLWSAIDEKLQAMKNGVDENLVNQIAIQLNMLQERQDVIEERVRRELAPSESYPSQDTLADSVAVPDPDIVIDSTALLQRKIRKTVDSLENYHAIAAAINKQFDEEITPLTEEINQHIKMLIGDIRDKENTTILAIDTNLTYLKIIVLAGLAILLIVLYFSFRIIQTSLKNSVERVKKPLAVLSQGDLPSIDRRAKDELSVITDEINTLSTNIGAIKDFAQEVGSGRFNSDINVFNSEGEIGKSLYDMKNSLQKVAQEEKERSWMNEGFAKFSDVLRQSGDNLSALSESVISNLVRYLNANQGGIFIVNDESKDNVILELTGCYAYERKKHLKKKVAPGEGLVGQCYLEKLSIYMTDIPPDYINIRSGLGGTNPGNLFIAPLKFNETVYGIIEIASFNLFQDYELEFVEKIAESIASTISSVKINEHTKKLLEESQLATEQLRAQEEEMRQNMEELAATQEEMHRNQKAITESEQKTRLIFLNAFDAIVTCDENGQIDLFNPAAENIFGHSAEELQGKNVNLIMPDIKLHEGRFKEGEANLADGLRKNREIFQMRMKVESGTIGSQKIYLFFIEDVSAKKKEGSRIGREIERLNTEKESLNLQYSEAKNQFEQLISHSSFAFIKTDPHLEILFANEAFSSLWGIKSAAGMNLTGVFPALEELGGYEFLEDLVMHGQKPNLKITGVGANGKKIPVTCTLGKAENGNLLLIMAETSEETNRELEKIIDSRETVVREKLAQNQEKLKKLTAGEAYIFRKIKK